MTELRRKAFHIASGTAISLLYYHGLINSIHLIILLAIAIILFFLYKYYKIPGIHQLVLAMERKENMKNAGLGSLLFLLGCIIAVLIYQKNIAIASILILSWGDGISALIGPYGRTQYFNPGKTWEGILAGIAAGTIAAQFFVNFWHSIIAAIVVMLIEGLDLKIYKWKVDDNLMIPILAGLIMTLLG